VAFASGNERDGVPEIAALDSKDLLDGPFVCRVGRQAVESLRGEGKDAAGLENGGGAGDEMSLGPPGVDFKNFRH